MTIKMRFFRQEESYSCAVRSLQMVLSHFDIFPSYNELEDICNCRDDGTDVRMIRKVLIDSGLRVKIHTKTASADKVEYHLNKGRPVIVTRYVGKIDGEELHHASVAYDIDDTFVYTLDPATFLYTEPHVKIKRKNLDRLWKIRPEGAWMIAVFR